MRPHHDVHFRATKSETKTDRNASLRSKEPHLMAIDDHVVVRAVFWPFI